MTAVDQVLDGEPRALDIIDLDAVIVFEGETVVEDHDRDGELFERPQVDGVHFGGQQDDSRTVGGLEGADLLRDAFILVKVGDEQMIAPFFNLCVNPLGEHREEWCVRDDVSVALVKDELDMLHLAACGFFKVLGIAHIGCGLENLFSGFVADAGVIVENH